MKEIKYNNTNILSLLPHSPKTLLNDQSKKFHILKLLKFLVEELDETLSIFHAGRIFKFDPHVGDTLCQIRAYKIFLLTCKGLSESDLMLNKIKHQIEQQIHNFSVLIKQKNGKYCKELDSSEEIYDFLQKKELIFELSQDLIFLVQAKMLSDFGKVDKEGISRGIDYEKFCIKASITKSLSKRIMHYYQQNLAEMSCIFLKELLKDLPELNILDEHFDLLKKVDKDGRWVLPCYEVTKILLKHIIKNKRPILLIIERRCGKNCNTLNLLYTIKANGNEFSLVDNLQSPNIPCIIIKGITLYAHSEFTETKECFVKRLNESGLEKIIMGNMACHPQYSAPELHHLNSDPYFSSLAEREELNVKKKMQILKDEFVKMQKIGYLMGCSIENSFLFLIRHIFCDFANHYLKYKELI